MAVIEITEMSQLSLAQEGSWYTVCGAGGDLQEWIDGYEKEMVRREIGTPVGWYHARGSDVNVYALSLLGPVHPQDLFRNDLSILMFPCTGLHLGRLAMFKLMMEDRWFDDIIANLRSRQVV